MNTQYRKNLKDVATACKNYTDKKIDDLKWELGSHTLDVESDTTTAYVKTVPTGTIGCTLDKIGGMSYKYNQLVQNGNFESTSNWDFVGGTSSVSNNTLIFTTNTVDGANIVTQGMVGIIGHKYLLLRTMKSSVALTNAYNFWGTAQDYYNVSTSFELKGCIFTYASGQNLNIFRITDGSAPLGTTIEIKQCSFIDLTAIFGSGNEPSDVASAIPLLQTRGYKLDGTDEYNAGTIRDSAVTSVVSKGFNVWDEQWEVGGYDNNGDTTSIQAIRSKNYISILPNTDYYFRMPNITNVTTRRLFYTINKELISSTSYPTAGAFTTPSNAYYMKFNTSTGYGTTYNNDICINLSNSANGTYKPYIQPITKQIPAEVQALDGYGWGINDTCYNYIDFETKKFVKKVGRVDLGTLTWSKDGNNRFYNRYSNDLKPNTNTTLIPNIICSKYNAVTYNNIDSRTKEGITIINSNNIASIFIYDTNYNDTTAFKTAMSGVYLYYELAEPVETDISEYIDNGSIVIEADGTLTFTNTYNQAVPSEIDYLIEEVKA